MAVLVSIATFLFLAVLIIIRRIIVRGGVHIVGKAVGSQFKPTHPLNRPVSPAFQAIIVLLATIAIMAGCIAYAMHVR